jgi:hypothetical protein
MKTTRILVLFLMFLWPTMMLTAVPAGTLILEKGKVRIRSHNIDMTYQEPGKQIPVQSGDEIQTGTNTRATIKLTKHGDDIDLFSGTFFRLSHISEKKQEVFMPVGKGKFLIKKSPKKGLKRRFSIRTANSLIRVKGTEIVVVSFGDQTFLITVEGVATLQALKSLGLTVVPVVVAADQTSGTKTGLNSDEATDAPPEFMAQLKTMMDESGFSEELQELIVNTIVDVEVIPEPVIEIPETETFAPIKLIISN